MVALAAMKTFSMNHVVLSLFLRIILCFFSSLFLLLFIERKESTMNCNLFTIVKFCWNRFSLLNERHNNGMIHATFFFHFLSTTLYSRLIINGCLCDCISVVYLFGCVRKSMKLVGEREKKDELTFPHGKERVKR